jgi:3-polyprenyl-4-hydroxybenzoate decarboxylase
LSGKEKFIMPLKIYVILRSLTKASGESVSFWKHSFDTVQPKACATFLIIKNIKNAYPGQARRVGLGRRESKALM